MDTLDVGRRISSFMSTKWEQYPESFATYVEELQDLSQRRGLRFGSPSDLTAFVLRISESSEFRAEVGSMIRSYVYRENLKISATALLDLLSLAWCGTDFAEAEALAKSDRDVLVQFVDKALKPSRLDEDPLNAVPKEPSESLDVSGNVANPQSDARAKHSSDRLSKAMERTISSVGLDDRATDPRAPRPFEGADPWANGSVLHLALRRFAEETLSNNRVEDKDWKLVLSAFLRYGNQ